MIDISQVEQCVLWLKDLLLMIWNGIFKVPLFTGPAGDITGATLLIGVFAVSVSIWVIHYFRDNTNAHMGGKR